MKKVLFVILNIIFCGNVLAVGVDEVFTDIDKDFKYYRELQNLYDKGIIKAELDGLFRPKEFLTRDVFTGIVAEVSCSKCIFPNTPGDLVSKYFGEVPFGDLNSFNKNFYCIADMNDKNFVKGYDEGYECQNGVTDLETQVFCPNNEITAEEAIAILLRTSKIFSIEDNELVKEKIVSGQITEKLSEDVSPFNEDGGAYTFYGYLEKALDYSFVDKIVNEDGSIDEIKYSLLELDENGNINPKKSITKEEYIKMAYVVFRKNNCNLANNENYLAVAMSILDASCTAKTKDCKKPDISENIYDFKAETKTTCEKGIAEYKWIFNYMGDTDKGYKKLVEGEYVDNYDFKDDSGKLLEGEWHILLLVLDACNNASTIEKKMLISSKGDFSANMVANPIFGAPTLKVDFLANVFGNIGNLSYDWTFGDGSKGVGKIISHYYTEEGYYNVELIVRDKVTGKTVSNTAVITVDDAFGNNDDNDGDIDGDGVLDSDDDCILIPGPVENNGCPILDSNECKTDDDCDIGQTCDLEYGYCVLDTDGDKVPDSKDDCRLTPGPVENNGCPYGNIEDDDCLVNRSKSVIAGGSVCNTCPCDIEVDFRAEIRKCDIVFPTILSPDGKDIYAKGENYVVKND